MAIKSPKISTVHFVNEGIYNIWLELHRFHFHIFPVKYQQKVFMLSFGTQRNLFTLRLHTLNEDYQLRNRSLSKSDCYLDFFSSNSIRLTSGSFTKERDCEALIGSQVPFYY